jgi:hypothetical protein
LRRRDIGNCDAAVECCRGAGRPQNPANDHRFPYTQDVENNLVTEVQRIFGGEALREDDRIRTEQFLKLRHRLPLRVSVQRFRLLAGGGENACVAVITKMKIR